MQETRVQYLVWENLLEKGMATESSIPAWRTPMNRGDRWASQWGFKESHVTERLTLSLQFHYLNLILPP